MIVLDIETTGLDPEKHAILSIGALDFSNPENQFYEECYIWEGAECMQATETYKAALEVNGFTEEQIQDKSKNSSKQIIEKFSHWIQSCEEHTFAGQNPYFDLLFIHRTAEREKIPFSLAHRSIDLHALAYTHYLKRGLTPPIKNKRTNVNLDNTLLYVGLPEEPKPHNALTGAKVCAEALSRILFAKKLLKDFTQYDIPDYLKV